MNNREKTVSKWLVNTIFAVLAVIAIAQAAVAAYYIWENGIPYKSIPHFVLFFIMMILPMYLHEYAIAGHNETAPNGALRHVVEYKETAVVVGAILLVIALSAACDYWLYGSLITIPGGRYPIIHGSAGGLILSGSIVFSAVCFFNRDWKASIVVMAIAVAPAFFMMRL